MTGHALPKPGWGAQLLDGGGARFRLWAPAQRHVALVDTQSDATMPMRRADDGWFELDTDRIKPGGAYAFQLDDGMRTPDPASRAQAGDVHGPSLLIAHDAYDWKTPHWQGRPWREAVIYELHVGAFTPEGTFAGVERKLDHLADLGVTAIELMPVAHFSGARGWGYDGVLPYAPHPAYGRPDDLRRLVDAAHQRGLMALLDVVYNHFGPDGNYLHLYAPQFFDPNRQTPWGAGIDYTRQPVRRFFIENAIHWLEEYRFDGLRLDAIDQIRDPSSPSILEDLATEARTRLPGRHIHLTTEDERNIVSLHQRDADGAPKLYTAEWNDDFHHAAHVLATGERDGYYLDYADCPAAHMARILAEGFAYQGEGSPFHDLTPRGEPSVRQPPDAFIDFLQNHDQIGNRAFGERLAALAPAPAIDALSVVLLMSPHIPLLFMGEEWAETRPFLFFADFSGDLADAVREGRRREFARWPQFQDPHTRERIPDPNAPSTFAASQIDWDARARPANARRLDLIRRLLAVRRAEIVPRLGRGAPGPHRRRVEAPAGLALTWRYADAEIRLTANLCARPWSMPADLAAHANGGRLLVCAPDDAAERMADPGGALQAPPWSAVVRIEPVDAT